MTEQNSSLHLSKLEDHLAEAQGIEGGGLPLVSHSAGIGDERMVWTSLARD